MGKGEEKAGSSAQTEGGEGGQPTLTPSNSLLYNKYDHFLLVFLLSVYGQEALLIPVSYLSRKTMTVVFTLIQSIFTNLYVSKSK